MSVNDSHPYQVRFSIGNRKVGEGCPAYIIAEAGSNHDGDYETAKQLIRMAKRANADAIKFQLFRADTLVNKKEFPEIHEKLAKYEFPLDWLGQLMEFAKREGVEFLATPFDEAAVDCLKKFNAPAYKVASGDLTYHGLVEKIAKIGRPLLLSTGMANLDEISSVVEIIRRTNNPELILLHCVTNYPAKLEEQNLKAISLLREKYNCLVGFSDHTLDEISALGAVSLGACVIEKHFTLKRRQEGLDHPHSMEPEELKSLIEKIRALETALGNKSKTPQESELPRRLRARRGVYAVTPLSKGQLIQMNDLIMLRPRKEIGAEDINGLIGKPLKQSVNTLEEVF
ncbi:MAG: N-acetylneuraminate synthase family protein [Candidatus Omnitrophica bacterium]|nr:N-acetylneuraminate synthase family protein [Candidatus Omnitrophota bacterium]